MAVGLDIKISNDLLKKIENIDKKLSDINKNITDIGSKSGKNFDNLNKSLKGFSDAASLANVNLLKVLETLNNTGNGKGITGLKKVEELLDAIKNNTNNTYDSINKLNEAFAKISSSKGLDSVSTKAKEGKGELDKLVESAGVLLSMYDKIKAKSSANGSSFNTKNANTKIKEEELKAEENIKNAKRENQKIDENSANPIKARLEALKYELVLIDEKLKRAKEAQSIEKNDKIFSTEKGSLNTLNRYKEQISNLKIQSEQLIKELNNLYATTNKKQHLSSNRNDINDEEKVKRILELQQRIVKINEEISNKEKQIQQQTSNYNNLNQKADKAREYNKILDEQVRKLNKEYELILAQIQALEQVTKTSNSNTSTTSKKTTTTLSAEDEINRRREANRKFYEEQERLAQKQAQLEQKNAERRQKEQERLSKQVERDAERRRRQAERDEERRQRKQAQEAIALEKRKQQVLDRWYSSSPKRALKYSSNTKSLDEEAKAIKYLIQARNKLDTNSKNYRRTLDELNKAINKHKSHIAEATGAHKMFNTIQTKTRGIAEQLRRSLLLVFSLSSLKGYVTKLIAIRGEFELQQRSLQAILQNKEKANEIWDKTIELAVKSPFTIKELVTYTKQMAAYRVETDKLYDSTKMLADVSAGLGVDMQRLILAYGQVKAANYLRGTELRQFSEAGINILGELSTYFSEIEQRYVSVGEVFEMVSKRLVSFQDVDAIFRKITSEGGTFYNMQEIQAQTIKGMLSNLKDSTDIVFNEIGLKYEETIKRVIESLKLFLDRWNDWVPGLLFATKTIIVSWLLLGTIFSNNMLIFVNFIKNIRILLPLMKSFKTAMEGIKMAGMGGLGVARMAIKVVTALVALVGYWVANKRAEKEIDKELNDIYKKNNAEISISLMQYEKLTNIIKDNTKSYAEQQSALLKLQQIYGDILPDHLKEYEAIRNNANAYREASNAIKEYYNNKKLEEGKKEIEEFYSNDLADVEKNIKDDINTALRIGSVKDYRQRSSEILQALISEIQDGNEVTYEEIKNLLKQYVSPNMSEGAISSNAVSIFKGLQEYSNLLDELKAKQEALYNPKNLEELNFSEVYNKYGELLNNNNEVTNNIINNLDIIKKYLNGNKNISKELYENALNYNKKWYNEVFKDQIDYGTISNDVFAFEAQVLKIKEKTTQKFINDLKQQQSKANEESKEVWQKFIDDNTKKLDLLGGSKLQKEVRRVAKDLSESFNIEWKYVQALIPSETTTRDDFAKSLKETIDAYEKELGQYKRDLNKGAEFALFDEERIQYMQKMLPMLKEFYTYFYTEEKKSGNTDIFSKQLEVLRGMYEKYQELIKTFGKEYSKGAVYEGYADAFKEAFGYDFKESNFFLDENPFYINSGTYEDTLDKMSKLAQSVKDRLKVLKEKGRVSFEIDVKLRKESDEEVNNQIDKLFSDYENLIELRSIGVSDKFAKAIFGLDTKNLQQIRDRIEQELTNTEYGEDQINKLKEYEKRVTEMEQKELQDRLKKYIEFTRESISEKAKLKYDEYVELMKVDETFQKKIEEAQDDETKSLLQEAYMSARQGVIDQANEKIQKLEWESLKNSDMMISLFNDLKIVGGQSLDYMIGKLNSYKNQWTNLPINEMKEVISLMDKLEQAKIDFQIIENPFKIFKDVRENMAGRSVQNIKDEIQTDQENIFSYENQISHIDVIIQKLEEGQDVTKELNTYNYQYGVQLQKNITALKGVKKGLQENINKSKENIKENNKTLLLFDKQKTALQSISKSLSRLDENVKNLVTPIKEIYDLTQEDDGFVDIFYEMADGMWQAVINAIQMQIQTKMTNIELIEAGVSAKAFGVAMNTAMGVIGWIVMAIQLIVAGIKAAVKSHDNRLEVQIEQWAQAIERLERAYEKLEEAINNSMDFQQFNKNNDEAIKNLEKRIKLTENSMKAEEDKKKKDEDKIQEYKDTVEDLKDELEDLKEKRIEALGGFGSTENVKSSAEEFIDTWYDAFSEGEDMIDALSEKWDEFIDNMVKKQIFYNVANKYLDNVLRQVDTYLEDGKLSKEDIDEISKLKDQSVLQINEVLTQLMDSLGITSNGIKSELDGLSKSKIELTEDTGQSIEAILNSNRQYVIKIYEILNNWFDKINNFNFNSNPIMNELSAQTRYIEDIKLLLNSVIDKSSFTPYIRVKI